MVRCWLWRMIAMMAVALSGEGRAADGAAVGASESKRYVIIKADDVKGPAEKWDRFLEVSRKEGAKVTLGVIAVSLENADPAYAQWLRDQQGRGDVEVWNHGLYHTRVLIAGQRVPEFNGSGFDYQLGNIAQSQALLAKAVGEEPIAFGTPGNNADADTAKAINATAALKLFFTNNQAVAALLDKRVAVVPFVAADMLLKGERPGTAQQVFDKKVGVKVMGLQVHPMSFTEKELAGYAEVLRHLQATGWTICLPSEYVGTLVADSEPPTSQESKQEEP